MRFSRIMTACALAVTATVTACSNNDGKRSDSALQNDLSLAAQQQQSHLDSISAAEANNPNAAPNGTTALRAPGTTTVRRTTTTASAPRRTSSRSSSGRTSSGVSSSGSSGTVATTSGGEVTVKHTQRDAAIGAAAGAVIGATTSRSKVKGGIIGAAVGGILGGVIGNNVDKQKKPPM